MLKRNIYRLKTLFMEEKILRFKRIMILTIVLVTLLAVSAVSAAENATGDVVSVKSPLDDSVGVENQTGDSGENSLIGIGQSQEILTANQGTYTDLRNDIGSGGNINLTKSYYRYTAGDGSTIEINNPGLIDGKGAVIDMAGLDIQAFYVTASGVTIKNLTIKNVKFSGSGAAVYFNKYGKVEDCNFSNNSATKFGGAVYFNSNGDVLNCNFTENTATQNGGAIYFGEDATGRIVNCNFTSNNAPTGSAICFYSTSSNNTVSNSCFLNNRANAEALEVIKNDNNITITFTGNDNLLNAIYSVGEVTFTNVTYWGAKGIANTGNSTISLSPSNKEAGQYINVIMVVNDIPVLNDFKVTDENGAIVLDIVAGNCTITARHYADSYYTEAEKTLTFNTTGNETRLELFDSRRTVTAKITPSNVEGNITFTVENEYRVVMVVEVALNGGVAELDLEGLRLGIYYITAIYGGNSTHYPSMASTTYATYETLSDEIALEGNIELQYDYYIFNHSSTIVNNEDNKVIDGRGAVIDMEGSTIQALMFIASGVTIKNLTIKNANFERGGGGIYFSSYGTVENCNFINNNVSDYGGAVFFDDKGNVVNCTFINNSASRGGGAVYFNMNGEGNVVNCTFINNSASSDGGAVYFNMNGEGNVVNCTFINNSASSDGGAVFFYDKGNVVNCTFINNTATDFGGAVVFEASSNGTVTNCTFINNTATDFGGGAFYMYSGSVENCTFTNNKVTGDDIYGGGAVIFWFNGNVINCNFTDNSAVSKGGAIYFSGGNSTVSGCIFVNNSASDYAAVHLPYGDSVISRCIFMNNSAANGVVGAAWNSFSSMEISNNIFLNNDVNQDVIDLAYFVNLATDYNWFGNTADNYDKGVPSATSNVWLFLNATANPNEIPILNSSEITFKLYSYNKTLGTEQYDNTLLMPVNLTITSSTNGEVNSSLINMGDAVTYTAKEFGDASVTGKFETVSYTIKLKNTLLPTEITVNPTSLDLFVGDEEVIVAGLTPADAGNVTFTSSNESVVIVDAECNVIAMGKGQAIITVSFAGDNKYAAAENKTVTVDVSLNEASVTVDNDTLDLKVGETYAINATKHPDTILLDITYKSSDDSVASVDENGVVTAVGEGSAIITVSVGDGEIYAENSTIVNVTVNKVDPSENIKIEVDNLTYGQNTTVDVALPSDATGDVTLKVDGKLAGAADVINGTANLTVPSLTAGNHTIEIIYSGDNKYSEASKTKNCTVSKQNTTAEVSVPANATYGDNESVNIKLPSDATGNVTVKADGEGVGFAEVINGTASIVLPALSAGNHEVEVVYSGDDKYTPVSETANVTVKKAAPNLTANAKTFKDTDKTNKYTVTLKDSNGNPIANATVTLKVDGKTYTAKTNSNGVATFKLNKLTKKGTFTAVITYAGDANYNNISVKAKIVVKSAWKTISKGSKYHSMVKKIQKALKMHGFYLSYNGRYLKVDGIFHIYTQKAVKQFQKANKLKVTGKVDEKTAKKLGII